MRIVVTGDRSANPGLALPVVQQVLLKLLVLSGVAASELEVVFGGLPGVEQAVQFAVEAAGLRLTNLEQATKDWDEYAGRLAALNPSRVFFLHGSPESSRLYPALTRVFGDDVFELVDPNLLFAPSA